MRRINELVRKLQRMVGFRNIAVHDYQDLNLDIIESIIKNNLGDFLEFSKVFLKLESSTSAAGGRA